MPDSSHALTPMSFGRVVEFVGLVGIILSLVFLGYELKRSNDIAEAEAVAEIYMMTNEMGLVMAENQELSRVFRQAQADFESLNPEERYLFYVLLEYVINTNEAAWKYYDKGIISRREADSYTLGLCRLITLHSSLLKAWQSRKQDRISGFFDYATETCHL